jgi:putative nucleotidyltransferase with HDIG domain
VREGLTCISRHSGMVHGAGESLRPFWRAAGRGLERAGWRDSEGLCYICKTMTNNEMTNTGMPTRDEAWKLVCEYTQSESLRKHMLAVETCVRAYARKNGADEALWGLSGLLHDFDYERFPNNAHAADAEHPAEGAKILRAAGYPEEVVRAILSHADYCNVARVSPLEHSLFACDELAGFLVACTYVRPSKSILDLEADSVKKRLKDKAFARGVNRDDVRKGAEELGVPLEEHIAFCIGALRENAEALGIRGTL